MCWQCFGNLPNASPCLTVSFCLWHPPSLKLTQQLAHLLICTTVYIRSQQPLCFTKPPTPPPPRTPSAQQCLTYISHSANEVCRQVFWYEKLSHLQLCWLHRVHLIRDITVRLFSVKSDVLQCGHYLRQTAFEEQVNMRARLSKYTVYIPTLTDGPELWIMTERTDQRHKGLKWVKKRIAQGLRHTEGTEVGAAGPLHQKEKSWGSSVIWSGSSLHASCCGGVGFPSPF